MIFNEYGWEVKAVCRVYDDDKEKFLKILIYHE